MKMTWTYKAVGFGLTAVMFYVAGVSYGAISEKKTVSVYDLKQAISALIDDVQMLRAQVNMLTRDTLETRKEAERLRQEVESLKLVPKNYKPQITVTVKPRNNVRLYPWGKVLGSVPKGTKVVLFGKEGKWCLTNLGYMHCSLLKEVPDGN